MLQAHFLLAAGGCANMTQETVQLDPYEVPVIDSDDDLVAADVQHRQGAGEMPQMQQASQVFRVDTVVPPQA